MFTKLNLTAFAVATAVLLSASSAQAQFFKKTNNKFASPISMKKFNPVKQFVPQQPQIKKFAPLPLKKFVPPLKKQGFVPPLKKQVIVPPLKKFIPPLKKKVLIPNLNKVPAKFKNKFVLPIKKKLPILLPKKFAGPKVKIAFGLHHYHVMYRQLWWSEEVVYDYNEAYWYAYMLQQYGYQAYVINHGFDFHVRYRLPYWQQYTSTNSHGYAHYLQNQLQLYGYQAKVVHH